MAKLTPLLQAMGLCAAYLLSRGAVNANAQIQPSAISSVASSSGVQSQSSERKPSKPYGIFKIEDTDIALFTASLLNQLQEAGMQAPQEYNIFPDKLDNGYVPMTDGYNVTGQPADGSFIADKHAALDGLFQNERLSRSLVFESAVPFFESRIFVALHETTHYVADHLTADGKIRTNNGILQPEDGETLEDRVYRTVNNIGNADFDAYEKKLRDYVVSHDKTGEKDNADIRGSFINGPVSRDVGFQKILNSLQYEEYRKLVGANWSRPKVSENIGDVGAALYLLSNYGDTAANRLFLKQWSDFRMAEYTNGPHDTEDSLSYVLKSPPPPKGLSIVQTTLLAAEIIEQHTARTPDMGLIFAKLDLLNQSKNKTQPADLSVNVSPDIKQAERSDVEAIRAAKNNLYVLIK